MGIPSIAALWTGPSNGYMTTQIIKSMSFSKNLINYLWAAIILNKIFSMLWKLYPEMRGDSTVRGSKVMKIFLRRLERDQYIRFHHMKIMRSHVQMMVFRVLWKTIAKSVQILPSIKTKNVAKFLQENQHESKRATKGSYFGSSLWKFQSVWSRGKTKDDASELGKWIWAEFPFKLLPWVFSHSWLCLYSLWKARRERSSSENRLNSTTYSASIG